MVILDLTPGVYCRAVCMWLHYSGAASQQMSPLGVAAHRENGGSDVENRGGGE